MKTIVINEEEIDKNKFVYHAKMEGYTTLMSYIPKLYEIMGEQQHWTCTKIR